MIDEKLLEILVCPENNTPLSLADEGVLAELNRAVAAGSLRNRAGRTVEEPIAGGLIREDRALLYPIVDGIPVLLIDEAIQLA